MVQSFSSSESSLASFQGKRVLALESRMSGAMEKLILRHGGVPQVAPSLREVPLDDDSEVLRFFEELSQGYFHLTLLMTGVGLKALLKNLEQRFSKEEILVAFQKTQVVVRGPKPTLVCKTYGIPIAVTVPEPNTWQEILQSLSEQNLLNGSRLALLEYGKSDPHFVKELQSRGAQVQTVPVYRWALPEDLAPLQGAVQSLLAGQVDFFLLTNTAQIDHLLQMVSDPWKELALRRALTRVVVVSIGPTTSARLRELQVFPDLEVFPNKLDQLVAQAAEQGAKLLDRKRGHAAELEVRLAVPGSFSEAEQKQCLLDSDFYRACRRQPVKRTPVWLMRQAGRYMAEYQLLRQGKSFLDFCKDPELTTEATLGAVERLGVDAAILFSDILPILEPMGMSLAYRELEGPVIGNPLRSRADIEKLRPVVPEADLSFALTTVREVRRRLHPRIPLIGFSGAPFTLASYMIEGRGSRNYVPTKVLMEEDSQAWHLLMEKLSDAVAVYLQAQVRAGCQVLQIFDSWVGCLSPAVYREYVFPHMRSLFLRLPEGVPVIHFGTGNATLIALMQQAGGDVIGLDWRMPISETWSQLGTVAVQGNLDPVLLFAEPKVFLGEAERILREVGGRPGFIFNVGHGILPETPVDHVIALVDFVHRWKDNASA